MCATEKLGMKGMWEAAYPYWDCGHAHSYAHGARGLVFTSWLTH